MWQYILGAWLFTSVFSDSYEKRRRKYNRLVAKHRKQLDDRIENYIRLINLDSIAERGIADGLGENLHIFSAEEIDYILAGIYEELPDSAIRISQMIDEMPLTPQPRGFGVDFV
jgi:hypothetical protein